MATTLTVFQDKQWISDFIKWEQDQRISRQVATVGVSQTLLKGQVVANSGAGIDDVQVFTLTCTDITDGGSVKFQYGDAWDLRSAAVAFGASLSAANVQTALRALGVLAGDVALAACTVVLSVAAAGATTAVYTVTCTAQYVPPLQVVENTLVDGTVAATLGTGTTSNVGVHTMGASANNLVVLPAAVTDSQTLTLYAGTDGGYFSIFYKGQITAPQAWNVSGPNLQTAVRALHADLAACSVNLTSEVYTITTAGVACDDIAVINDTTTDGGVFEGGITCAHGTQGVALGQGEYAIMLQDVTTTASVPRQALVLTRQAMVDADQLSFGANVTTIAGKAAVLARLEANKLIVARREPDTSTTQTV